MFICINLSADERGLVSCVPHCGHDYEMITKTPGGASYHAGITGKHMICFFPQSVPQSSRSVPWALNFHVGFSKHDFLIAPQDLG